MPKNDTRVYSGEQALIDFLDPRSHPATPLVELTASSLNPFKGDGVHIYAKLMPFNSLHNIKSLGVYNMLDVLRSQGSLAGKHTLVENSSGNAGASLAVIGRAFGLEKFVVLVPKATPKGKIDQLRLVLGSSGRVVLTDRGIDLARIMAQQQGWISLNQYDNPSNAEAYEQVLGPQLWQQTEGDLSIFCAGLGTAATFIGTSRYLKGQLPSMHCVAVACKTGETVSGVRSCSRLAEVGNEWRPLANSQQEVCNADSKSIASMLVQLGISAGPSSGFALKGLLQEIGRLKNADLLDRHRNIRGEVVCAFICPDGHAPYIGEMLESALAASIEEDNG